MIPVQRAVEHEEFEARVRAPGRALLRVLVGQDQPGGRWHKRRAVATRLEEVPTKALYPLWQKQCLGWVFDAYDETCAYLGVRICREQARPTVDHFVPQAAGAWGRVLAYEWGNYRLSALRPNQDKSTSAILDPFEIEDGWFALDLVMGQIKPGERLPTPVSDAVEATIEALDLDNGDHRQARRRIIGWWENGMAFSDVLGVAPFIAREIRRQGGSPLRAYEGD